MKKKLQQLIAALLAELLDGEPKMSARNKLLILNAILVAVLIALLSCSYSGSVTSTFRHATPGDDQSQRQERPARRPVFDGASAKTRP